MSFRSMLNLTRCSLLLHYIATITTIFTSIVIIIIIVNRNNCIIKLGCHHSTILSSISLSIHMNLTRFSPLLHYIITTMTTIITSIVSVIIIIVKRNNCIIKLGYHPSTILSSISLSNINFTRCSLLLHYIAIITIIFTSIVSVTVIIIVNRNNCFIKVGYHPSTILSFVSLSNMILTRCSPLLHYITTMTTIITSIVSIIIIIVNRNNCIIKLGYHPSTILSSISLSSMMNLTRCPPLYHPSTILSSISLSNMNLTHCTPILHYIITTTTTIITSIVSVIIIILNCNDCIIKLGYHPSTIHCT